jgi:hypothetical protein
VYLVFAQDDPVLSISSVAPVSMPETARMLNILRTRPNFRIFNPQRGAHLGYILDSAYLLGSIKAFFN